MPTRYEAKDWLRDHRTQRIKGQMAALRKRLERAEERLAQCETRAQLQRLRDRKAGLA